MTTLKSLVDNVLSRSQSATADGRQGSEVLRNGAQQMAFPAIAPGEEFDRLVDYCLKGRD